MNWKDLEIIVDSPLAARFTEVYRELKPYWDQEAQRRLRAGRHPLSFENLYTVDSHEEHEKTVSYLARTRRPAVVLAASGMAAGGRIVNYLKAMIGDPQHCVLFVGYQASGTPGRTIQKYAGEERASNTTAPWVTLDHQRYEIRAMVRTIGGYSAHADQKNLLDFVRRMHRWPSQIRIIHGTDQSRAALKAAYEEMALKAGKHIDIVLPVRS